MTANSEHGETIENDTDDTCTAEGGRIMKIIVDKYEYAKIICACQKTLDCFGCTGKCALSDVCNGRDDLEDSCEINDVED